MQTWVLNNAEKNKIIDVDEIPQGSNDNDNIKWIPDPGLFVHGRKNLVSEGFVIF